MPGWVLLVGGPGVVSEAYCNTARGEIDDVPEELDEGHGAGVEPPDADFASTRQADDMPLRPLDVEPPGRGVKDELIEKPIPKKFWRAIRMAREKTRFPAPTRVIYADVAASGEPPAVSTAIRVSQRGDELPED